MMRPLTKRCSRFRKKAGVSRAPAVPVDTTKSHRDDEKQNIREQGAHGNLTQDTTNRRMG